MGGAGEITGRCLCGAVTLRAIPAAPEVSICHCTMCRRWTGGVFACFGAEGRDVTTEGPITTYTSSSFSERAFCGTCGSHLWIRDEDGFLDLMPGLFEGAQNFALRHIVYADRAPAYAPVPQGVPTKTAEEYEAVKPHVDGVPR
jgi:hypothetical protein